MENFEYCKAYRFSCKADPELGNVSISGHYFLKKIVCPIGQNAVQLIIWERQIKI